MVELSQYILEHPWVLILIALWTVPWKGYALWKSARFNQPVWFVALLLVNTLAILEILYIFVFSKKKPESGSTN